MTTMFRHMGKRFIVVVVVLVFSIALFQFVLSCFVLVFSWFMGGGFVVYLE